MRVKTADRHFTVSWKHRTKGSKKGTRVFVSEFLPNEEEPKLVAEGKSYLHKGDTYSKNTGRIRSLTRALEQLFPGHQNREARNAFWDAYKKMEHGGMVKCGKYYQLRILKEVGKRLGANVEDAGTLADAFRILGKKVSMWAPKAEVKTVPVLTPAS